MRPTARIAVALALAAAGIVAWRLLAAPATPVRVRVGVTPQVICAALRVASLRGDFVAAGLDVELVEYPSGRDALDAALRGEIDVATVAETPVVHARVGGKDVVVWATLAESRSAVRLLARTDRGVATPTDLAGRRIGVALGTNSEFWLDRFLRLNGVPRSALILVDVPASAAGERLAAGEVDAVVTWDPHAWRIANRQDGIIAMADDALYRFTWNLAGPRDADVPVLRLLAAIDSANTRLASADAGLVADLAAWCDLPIVAVEAMLCVHWFRVHLDHSLLLAMEQQAQVLHALARPDLAGIADPRPLRALAPEAVAMPLDHAP